MDAKQLAPQNGPPSHASPVSTIPLPQTGGAGTGQRPSTCASFTRKVLASFFVTVPSGAGGSRTW
jgi:hypothetical protein